MFSKDKSSHSGTFSSGSEKVGGKISGVPSIVSADMKVIGDLKSSGDIQIDGTVEGDIDSRSLVVGEGARIKGSVTAETVRVAGAVEGQIKAQSVTLAGSAKVTGDITHGSLTMEAGAFLEGSVRRLEGGAGKAGSKVSAFPAAQNGTSGGGYSGGQSQAL